MCGQLFTARVQVLEHIVLESNARRSQVLTSDVGNMCLVQLPPQQTAVETSPNISSRLCQTGGDQLLKILQIQALAKFWSEANKNLSPKHCS